MPLDEKKITELRQQYNLSQSHSHEAICKKIAELSSSEIVPVVIAIAKEIKEQGSNEQTIQFLDKAIKVLNDYDEKQNVTLWSLPSLLHELGTTNLIEQTKNDIASLTELVNKIEIQLSTKALWGEGAYWLDSFYYRAYNAMPKDTHGNPRKEADDTYATTDYFDLAFKKAMGGTSRFNIALKFHEVAGGILKKMPLSNQNQSVANQGFLSQKTAIPVNNSGEATQSPKPSKQ